MKRLLVPAMLSIVLFPGLCFLVRPAAATNAEFRPALVGNGPKSLVNLINGRRLIEKGQGDAVVMFDAVIEDDPDGSVEVMWCRPGPGAKLLKNEVQNALARASFVPALIDGKRVSVVFHGTVIFMVRDGRPYLRVLANEDRNELAQQSNYIQPQLIFGSRDWYGVQAMLDVVKHHARTGHAVLSITVDADGKMQDRHLLYEEPKGLNIGPAAMKAYATAKFIPGFRNGKPVTCTFEEDWAVRGYVYHRL
jgi:hypothetical protein